MKIVFFGTPEFAVPSLERLISHPDFEVAATVTQPDKRRGRGNQVTPSPIKLMALNSHVPVWQPQRIKKDVETISLLRQTEADVFVVVAYGQILSQEILEIPRLGCINVHGSLLPKYRGAAPIQWSLYYGESETGITTMLMDAGMDTGAMLLKESTMINLLDNAETLGERLMELGADLLIETLIKLEQEEIEPMPQNDAEASYAPLIKLENYQLDWSRSALDLHDQIRGFYPNCVANFRGQSVKISATAPLGSEYWFKVPQEIRNLEKNWEALSQLSGKPGEVVHLAKGVGPIVQTGAGLLLLRELQLAGKRVQSGTDFVNGTRLQVGELFSS